LGDYDNRTDVVLQNRTDHELATQNSNFIDIVISGA